MAECFHFDFVAMGSPCSLNLYADDFKGAARIATRAIADVRRVELKYSRYQPGSYLSEINAVAKAGESILVDEETADLVDHAFRAHTLSGGLFDVTCGVMRGIWNDTLNVLPSEADIASLLRKVGLEKVIWMPPKLTFAVCGMELDLGGIAKEYAADRAANICRTQGISRGLVNLGGDIAVVGNHPDDTPWRIGIRDPFGSDTARATLFATGGGIATSGSYERYREINGHRFGHIINPKTGWPVEGLPSVTVALETCLLAGIYSSIALLMGERGPSWLRDSGCHYAYVDARGAVHGSVFSRQDS